MFNNPDAPKVKIPIVQQPLGIVHVLVVVVAVTVAVSVVMVVL